MSVEHARRIPMEPGGQSPPGAVMPNPPVAPQPKRRGRRAGAWFFGGGVALLLGYKVLPFYYYYFDIKSNCSQVLRNAAVESDEELRRDLLEVAERHGIEATARDIGIQRVGSRIKIWLNYKERLEVSFKGMTVTLYTFDFTPSAERVVAE